MLEKVAALHLPAASRHTLPQLQLTSSAATRSNEKPQSFALLASAGTQSQFSSPSAVWGKEGCIRLGRKARFSIL